MIDKFSVSNFRGIKHINVEGLKRMSLISGKNNVGKSTLLEALFLFMDHTSNEVFGKLNNFRESYISIMANAWEPLFYNMDMERVMSISVGSQNGESTLSFNKDVSYLPQNVSNIPEEVIAQFRSATKGNYSLAFSYVENEYKENGHFFVNQGSILRQMKTSLDGNEIKNMTPTRYINAAVARYTDNVIDSIGRLELSGEKKTIVGILQELDSEIEDIVTISRQNVSQLHIKVRGKWIPLQYAGDGVMKLLNICLAIMECKDGLLLIDEIETGFHYSMYGKLWRIIDETSQKSNCQIIASTHSYEMIVASKDNVINKDAYVFYRLGKNDESTTAYKYDYTMLDSALNAEMEVR